LSLDRRPFSGSFTEAQGDKDSPTTLRAVPPGSSGLGSEAPAVLESPVDGCRTIFERLRFQSESGTSRRRLSIGRRAVTRPLDCDVEALREFRMRIRDGGDPDGVRPDAAGDMDWVPS